jgi:hypothetical protein
MNERVSITVRFDNLTPAQAEAIESLFSVWVALGGVGSSRWTAFFADGDGNFHPRVSVNGKPAEHSRHVTESECWRGSEYRMDYDRIAWRLRRAADVGGAPSA